MRLVVGQLETEAAIRPDVQAGVRAALQLLRDMSGMTFWAIARVKGSDWTVAHEVGDGYRIAPGYTVPWEATICRRMAHGLGPRVAPNVDEVPGYAAAPIRRFLPIGAYAGIPLRYEGEVLGTLVGLDPAPRPAVPEHFDQTLETVATLVGTLLGLEHTAAEISRRAARAEVEAHVDNLTQLGNRLAWTKVLVDEEARCRRYGHSACVVSVDLDGLKRANDVGGHAAGDVLLRKAGEVLRSTSRTGDHVARVGGDEFAVLAVETAEAAGTALVQRLRDGFALAGVAASIGMAARERHGGIEEAWHAADAAMYADKRRRLNDRVIRALVDPDSVPAVRRLDLTIVRDQSK